jgi:hypothetical protein
LRVLNKAFSHPLEVEEKAAMPLAGGIMQHGYQCGITWGAALAAGAQAYHLFGPGTLSESMTIISAQNLVKTFRNRNDETDCLELTGTEWQKPIDMFKYFVKGGPVRCLSMASTFAPLAFRAINSSLSENHINAPSPPVSCTAMLAEKMGASELHQVMAAGLAGGIGLSGGACGALGAAIWIIEMNCIKQGSKLLDFNNPESIAAVDKFVECTGKEFKCATITGQRFRNVEDQIGYLNEGGCLDIIDTLAQQ